MANYYLALKKMKADSKLVLTNQQIAMKAGVSKNTVRNLENGKRCQEANARAIYRVFRLPNSFEYYASEKPFKAKGGAVAEGIVFREWEVRAEIVRREIARGIPFHVFKSENSLTKGRFARAKQFFLQSLNEEEIESARKHALPRHAEVCLMLKGNPRFPTFIDLGFGDDGTFWSLDEWEDGKTVRSLVEDHNDLIEELEQAEATHAELEEAKSRFYEEVPFIAHQTLLALNDLHQQGIIMRRLNPESIFVADSGNVQIRDFELAKINAVQSEPFNWHRSIYLASEVETGNVDARTDVRSWATVAMFLLLGRDPIGNPKDEGVRLKVPKNVADCLTKCCEIPSERPSVKDALKIIGRWAGK